MLTCQLTLKRSSTLELEDVQEDVSDNIDMGEVQVSEVHFALIIIIIMIMIMIMKVRKPEFK